LKSLLNVFRVQRVNAVMPDKLRQKLFYRGLTSAFLAMDLQRHLQELVFDLADLVKTVIVKHAEYWRNFAVRFRGFHRGVLLRTVHILRSLRTFVLGERFFCSISHDSLLWFPRWSMTD